MRKFTWGLLALTFVLSPPLVAGDKNVARFSAQTRMGPELEPNGSDSLLQGH